MSRPRLLGSLLCLAACGPSVGPGGSSATVGAFPVGIEEVPWHVSIQDRSSNHLCSGAILTESFVVTTQRCASAAELVVRAGIDRLDDTASGQKSAVVEVVRVPGYTEPEAGKDIALLRLDQPLLLDGRRIAPVAVVGPAAADLGLADPGVVATVTGWGSLSAGGPSPDDLEALRVPIVSSEEAQAAHGAQVTGDQLAAGDLDAEASDACPDEGGDPLVVPDAEGTGYLLAGLTSWSAGCDRPDAPGMYARVSAFNDFIAENLAPPEPPPAGLLLVNEVLADPGEGNDFNGDGVASTTDDEFIELVNIGDGALDLSGATVADGFGVRGTIPAGIALEPGEVLLIFGGGEPTGFDVETLAFALALNNDGDSITVSAADATVLAAMTYGAEGGQDQSLVRQVDATDTAFVLHTSVSEAPASPGVRSDGTPF
jgi:hypothetical protein